MQWPVVKHLLKLCREFREKNSRNVYALETALKYFCECPSILVSLWCKLKHSRKHHNTVKFLIAIISPRCHLFCFKGKEWQGVRQASHRKL